MSAVIVNWQQPDSDPRLWNVSRGLYAYLNLNKDEENEILYIGKVDGTTIRQRWCRSGKKGFWDALENERQIYTHSIIVGLFELPAGQRLSRELVTDVESLLINRLCPWGNIQCRNSRISRPGLKVYCKGDWPLQRNVFVDG
jgi:hypothetical protein